MIWTSIGTVEVMIGGRVEVQREISGMKNVIVHDSCSGPRAARV